MEAKIDIKEKTVSVSCECGNIDIYSLDEFKVKGMVTCSLCKTNILIPSLSK